jgi:adenylylsulfate kinase
MVETKRRSVLKALSWRVVAWSITVGIAYLFTGKAVFALAIGVADSVLKIFAYYLHERSWMGIGYGREPQAAFGVAPADDGRELAGVP